MNKKNIYSVIIFGMIGVVVGSVFHKQIIPLSFAEESEVVTNNMYKKCLTVTSPTPHMDTHFNAGRMPVEDRMVSIPSGWTPVGGFGSAKRGDGLLILCK